MASHDNKNWRISNGWMLLAVTVAAASVLVGLVAFPRFEDYYLRQTARDQEATLDLSVQSLRGALERYAPIPSLIAERPEVKALLNNPYLPPLRAQADLLLEQTAIALNASGVYLEDEQGMLVASVPPLAVDDNERRSYRPYFQQAVAGGIGQFFALGTQSGERGYFYAAPVRERGRINGIVVVKFSVEAFETSWNRFSSEFMVRDPNGIVFMSSRPDWIYRTTEPVSAAALATIRQAEQFPVDRFSPLTADFDKRDSALTLADVDGGQFVASSNLIARAGWRITILTPTRSAAAQARTATAVLIMAVLLAGLLAVIALQRRARLMERLQSERETASLLETRVNERTAELHEANRLLRGEIDERKAAEDRLRKTQKELIQAGKLAALGQMSAALSHEMNQPLAAIKVYAENAVAFLSRGSQDKAEENIALISSLADRMASISKHLRNFARRPQEKILPVPVNEVIRDALAIMEPRIKNAKATIIQGQQDYDLIVHGGRVRLQQVLVNLLGNALDAMADHSAAPTIWIDITTSGTTADISVRDNGPGLSESALANLFDPFFTTKDPGEGMGLGLSISYNIVKDFGGTITAKNHADGGAVFTVTLRLAESDAEQATTELTRAAS